MKQTMRKSILTIEDSKSLSYVLTKVFKNDFDVYLAKNYAEALRTVRDQLSSTAGFPQNDPILALIDQRLSSPPLKNR